MESVFQRLPLTNIFWTFLLYYIGIEIQYNHCNLDELVSDFLICYNIISNIQ